MEVFIVFETIDDEWPALYHRCFYSDKEARDWIDYICGGDKDIKANYFVYKDTIRHYPITSLTEIAND